MKKALALSLACVLLLGTVAGCGKKSSSENKPTGVASETTGKVNEWGWEMPKETIKFSIYAGQDDPDKDAKTTKNLHDYILKNFNVDITRIVYDTDSTEKLSLMLADGNYPDVITLMKPTEATQWAERKKAIDLTELIDTYGKDLKSSMGNIYDRMKADDGKVYSLSTYWGYLNNISNSAHIRMDWWEEAGKPSFATPDEYYAALKKMQAAHPTNSKGEKTFALSCYGYKGTYTTLMGMFGIKDQYKESADHTLTHWANTDEGLKATLWMNQIYRDGLLDPDAFTQTFDDWKEKSVNERFMGHIGAWWTTWNAGHESWQKLEPDTWKENKRYLQIAVKDPAAEKAYMNPVSSTGSYRTIITDKAKNPADIMKFINFSNTDLGRKLIGWGVPNESYSFWKFNGADKSWSYVDEIHQAYKEGKTSPIDWSLAGMQAYGTAMSIAVQPDKSALYPEVNFANEHKWLKSQHDYCDSTIYDFSAFKDIVINANDDISLVKQQIDDTLDTAWAAAVTAKSPEECREKFTDLQAKLKSAGINDLEKFYTEKYKANLEKYGTK